MQIKCYTYYDDFHECPVTDLSKPYINCYIGDFAAREPIGDNAIVILQEPRSIEHLGYEYVEKHPEEFKYIFTYDSKLLKLPNAYMFNWGSIWCTSDIPKTKGISMVSSDKECCELHKVRKDLALQFDRGDKVDCFGTFRGNPADYADTHESHAEYRFAIVIENYIDDYWYTEKILNCFSTKTVPIYYGARKIGELFNSDGIIEVKNWQDIPEIVEKLNIEKEYNKRKIAIEDNFIRVRPYAAPWRERFMKRYGKMLEDMINEA